MHACMMENGWMIMDGCTHEWMHGGGWMMDGRVDAFMMDNELLDNGWMDVK